MVLQSASMSDGETLLFLFSFSVRNQQPLPSQPTTSGSPAPARRWEIGFGSTPDCLSQCWCLFCLTMKSLDCP